ncbi:MAG: tryptophan--tRNA ligase [Anaerolineales bacterium]|nr:tryptophan--tRNA ligase [Anaerolineales bacterium]
MTRKISLSGVKPTGTLHLGNYLGMIRPALELAREYTSLYFIADYHALTTVHNGDDMRRMSYEITAAFLALGMDPGETIFFRQSDVPELFELTWILECFTPKGLMNRAHAYKSAMDANLAEERDPDAGINMGLYTYPVLMSADILLYGSHAVPVGQDQRQHVEIARDIAQAFNNNYGEVFVLPEAVIQKEVATIPGIDGRKMSKSYDNLLPIFAPAGKLRKRVMRVVTDSRPPEEPKNPDECNVFNIFKHFGAPEEIQAMRELYQRGGFGYGEVKQRLYETLERTFGQAREKYEALMNDLPVLEEILLDGSRRARKMGAPIMEKARKAIGVRYQR